MKRFLLAVLLTLPVFFSCSKDEEISKPVISDLEIGANNSDTANIGGHLHLEASIVAIGKIAGIRVLIHQEEEGEEAVFKTTPGLRSDEAFKIDTTYTGVYKGVKNTIFHEHLAIPASALPGIYHLHLYVTDQEGNQTMVEKEVAFIAGEDAPDME